MMKACWNLGLFLASTIPLVDAFVVPTQRTTYVASTTTSTTTTTTTQRDMCGLVALIGNDPDGPLEDIVPATERVRHRGPDGMEIKTERHAGGRFALGHTRLSIMDPSHAGDQPFELTFDSHKKGHTYHLAANGEIYNFESVYEKLAADGWTEARKSGSDCEAIAHAYAKYGNDCVKFLDGMFAFTIVEQDAEGNIVGTLAARDPVGIKPLYHGTSPAGSHVLASELKSLVGLVDPATVTALPPGTMWTPETGVTTFYNPDWLRKPDYAPWKDPNRPPVTDDQIRAAFQKAVKKRMMADVTYGFFLSGGVDSAIVAHELMPLYIQDQIRIHGPDNVPPIHTYTVGMENSPDVMAAKAVVESLGGSKYIQHHIRLFTPDEVFDLIPKIIYHMETYEAELIRSSIPNWLLAERAAQDVKMVLTGEGSDELFAGYLYFQDAESPEQVQEELKRIYGMLGNINLHRTDRMTMAHGLEARVPFLDTEFTALVMSVDPAKKMVDKEAVKNNARGREKTYLRELFEGPNSRGDSLPAPVLWRAKAMQCEGVGEDWVSILQRKIASLVSDEELQAAAEKYPYNTPQTKEELYYRRIYDEHFHGMEHVVKLWEGGGRAMGAAWKSDMYTREGLKNTKMLSHSLQQQKDEATTAAASEPKTTTTALKASPNSEMTSDKSLSDLFADECIDLAKKSG
mmetsp:Transcript_26856/g.50673  ORF Transcript_26856/g.50673 Transcript_26856/m.50673 type:complete len:686 (+) Transcript_26856:196-2253(+)